MYTSVVFHDNPVSRFQILCGHLTVVLAYTVEERAKRQKNNSEEIAVVIFSDCFYLSLNIFPKTIDINFMEA